MCVFNWSVYTEERKRNIIITRALHVALLLVLVDGLAPGVLVGVIEFVGLLVVMVLSVDDLSLVVVMVLQV